MNKIAGLYAITPNISSTPKLVQLVYCALEGGVSVVQYRNKEADLKLRLEHALSLLALCDKYCVPLIINDDVSLAKEIDAAGVHLGKDDTNIEAARQMLGRKKIIGVSCYNQLDAALDAQVRGADYVAFGSVFPSVTKPNAPPASLNILQDFKKLAKIPVAAVGGITLPTIISVVNHGADAIAISSALFGAKNVAEAAYSFSSLFAQSSKNANSQPTAL